MCCCMLKFLIMSEMRSLILACILACRIGCSATKRNLCYVKCNRNVPVYLYVKYETLHIQLLPPKDIAWTQSIYSFRGVHTHIRTDTHPRAKHTNSKQLFRRVVQNESQSPIQTCDRAVFEPPCWSCKVEPDTREAPLLL